MPSSKAADLATAARAVCIAGMLGAMAATATAEPVAVDVTGASEAVLCAEKDNVTLNFASPAVRRFQIEAAHPAYIASLQRDSFEADWTACDMRGDPVHTSDVKRPVRRTLYEEPELWVVGWTMPTYWRPAAAKVRIGDQVHEGLHLLQVWMIRPMGGEEVLVVYPQDGYWRIRPKAPDGMAPTAFGSSFLVGPVEVQGRPVVAISEIAFDPQSRAFTTTFARGGSALLRMSALDRNRHVLDVTLSDPIAGSPFASMRSMYVTEFNNDVARIAVREKGANGWREQPVMAFGKAAATDVWAGRTTVSRHNSSSPDMIFKSFSTDAARPEMR